MYNRIELVKLMMVSLALAALAPSPVRAQLYITELLALNDSTLADEDGDFSDWLEIHNAGASPADLDGWFLTDDENQPMRWQLPATVVAPGGYLLVFASGKDRAVGGQPLHASFALSGDGEYLALVRPDGVTVEHAYAPGFPPQAADVSYGLAADLVTERCFTTPTPGAANDESAGCGAVAEVVVSPERGFYEQPFTVEITTATAGADIYYTLDGSEPTASEGTLYTGPLAVTGTAVLRAAGFASGFQPSVSVTHTYIFPDQVLGQTGAGFPDTWAADYEMDPKVVADARYADALAEDLLAIPTLSLVMDVDDLFGADDGIYTHPSRTGIEWERPASAELIFPDGTTGFQINCGTRIQGDLSRSLNRKKSFRLAFKSIYGPAKLDYPLFGSSSVTSFDKIRLRASSEKSWSFGSKRATYVRDQWVRDTQLAMGRLASRGLFVHLYVNGLYWGVYNAVEKPDESFVSAHLGGEQEDWDVLKHYFEVVNGDRLAWDTAREIAAAGLESDAAYEALQQYIDVPNLIDYFITNIYAGTTDWDGNNWYAARRRSPGEGFKFFSWDAEQSMVSLKAKRTGVASQNRPSTFYSALRKDNEEFRVLFGDHVHRHFFNGGALTPARASARFLARTSEIDRAVVAESARWGDVKTSTPFTRDDDWLVEVEWLRLAYFPRRGAIVLDQLRQVDLYPSVAAPVYGQHGGLIAGGFELTVEAPQGTIYYTLDGSDPRLPGGTVAPGALAYAGPITLGATTTVKARALAQNGWSAVNEATFTVDVPLRVTELMYHPADPVSGPFQDDDFEFVEITNVGDDAIALTGVRFSDGIEFTFASGTLASGDRVLVVADRAAFESRYGGGLPVAGEYAGRLSNGGEAVRLEASDGQPILDFAYADSWYPSTDGGGHALVVRDASVAREAWSEADTWRPSTFAGGSPAAAELPRCSDGVDNDGDGAIDAGEDPGCADPAQDREDPECDDGIDNDDDGDVDANDRHCDAAFDDREAAPPLDVFVCYQARTSRLGERFERVELTLDDELDGAGLYTARKPAALCLPAAVTGAPVIDGATHLEAYAIRESSGTDKHVPQEAIFIESLGPTFIDTSRVDRLLMPATVDSDDPVPAPDNQAHEVDHYKCYKAKVSRRAPQYFPKGVQLAAAEAFEDRSYDLLRPIGLCSPVDAQGLGIKHPSRKLLCYKARRARGEPKHAKLAGVHTATQLGAELLDTRRVESICVPAH